MKKSVLALVVLGSFVGVAAAQSSVTIYGRVDQAYGKKPGANVQGLMDPSGSRIGFRGTEDLGGGLKASFNLEHRLYADDGSQPYGATGVAPVASGTAFWGARAVVGLEGGFGRVVVGREYTAAFLLVQNPLDPWKGDTFATIKPITFGGTPGSLSAATANIEPGRFNNSINYTFAAEGLTAAVSVSPKEDKPGKNAYSVATNYSAGPIFVGIAHTNPNVVSGAVTDPYSTSKWTVMGGTFDLGFVKPGVVFGTGTTPATASVASNKIRSWAFTAVAPMGANGQVRSLYGQRTSKNGTTNVSSKEVKQFSLGYWYSLSKRTTVYTDVVNDNGTLTTTAKTGYEVGLKHEF